MQDAEPMIEAVSQSFKGQLMKETVYKWSLLSVQLQYLAAEIPEPESWRLFRKSFPDNFLTPPKARQLLC